MFKEEDGTLYFEKHVVDSCLDPFPSASSCGGTAACEEQVGSSATKVTTRTWVEAPLLDTNQQKMLESIFQVSLVTMQRVSTSGFDFLLLSALRCKSVRNVYY